ncbi:hypothetical protein [Nostoc sp. LPT]|uniref:hypothetical protein n=1 Tax=Nostoc sp. LPT TaxID=2815387 RepID=UPI0025E6680D|nr:hypothetical protein [Nostoc sp. LPT]
MRQAAIIQSTESSNRIEGITAPLERIKELVAEKTTPRDRILECPGAFLVQAYYEDPTQVLGGCAYI